MTPMLIGFDLVLGAPTDFLAAPGDWLRWMSDYRGTVTCAPNFGYALAARAHATPRRPRPVGVAARPQRRRADRPAVGRRGSSPPARPTGSTRASALCVYGMAEATLAISFPDAGHRHGGRHVDRDTLERGRYAAPGSGQPSHAPGPPRPTPPRASRCASATRAPARPAADREVGELEVRGTSVTPGYYRRAGGERRQPSTTTGCAPATSGTSSTARSWCAGASRTSSSSGAATCSPRRSSGPRPAVDGVRAGNVIAFGMPRAGGARRGSSWSPRPRLDDRGHAPRRGRRPGLRRRRRPAARGGPGPGRVSLPKTSSGKLQRSRCRDQYLDDALAPA